MFLEGHQAKADPKRYKNDDDSHEYDSCGVALKHARAMVVLHSVNSNAYAGFVVPSPSLRSGQAPANDHDSRIVPVAQSPVRLAILEARFSALYA
jgi:hypothetical protein